jgi:hypothetical protein
LKIDSKIFVKQKIVNNFQKRWVNSKKQTQMS